MADALNQYSFQPWQALLIGVLLILAMMVSPGLGRRSSRPRKFLAHEIESVFNDWSKVVIKDIRTTMRVQFWEITDGENSITYSSKLPSAAIPQTECIEVNVSWAGTAIYNFHNRKLTVLSRKGVDNKGAKLIADSVILKIMEERARLRDKLKELDPSRVHLLGND